MTTVAERPYRYLYEPGTVRWCLLHDGMKPPRSGYGWKVEVIETNWHPTNFNEFERPQTWAKETYVGA